MNKKTIASTVIIASVITILCASNITQIMAYNTLQQSTGIQITNIESLNTAHAKEVFELTQSKSQLQSALDNKTTDYDHIKDAFAMYCNKTTIPLDNTWTEYQMEPWVVEDRPQGMTIMTYTNGTHLIARLYFEDTKIWTQSILMGTYAECNVD